MKAIEILRKSHLVFVPGSCIKPAIDEIESLQIERDQLKEITLDLERSVLKEIENRDHWESKATDLAELVGRILGVDVGQHSSANCPVESAKSALLSTETRSRTMTDQSINWDDVPEGFNWVATDSYGYRTAFKEKPDICEESMIWNPESERGDYFVLPKVPPCPGWRDTLEKRPQPKTPAMHNTPEEMQDTPSTNTIQSQYEKVMGLVAEREQVEAELNRERAILNEMLSPAFEE